MDLYFYRGDKPNFGDELNTWMWPKLIEGVWDTEDNSVFLGIGSILYDSFRPNKLKIVFGAGYGGYTKVPVIDEKWKFYFVRGKLTAKYLGLDESLAIGDSAILLRTCVKKEVNKRHKVSFMPHWGSTYEGNWELACKLASINYIDPCASVDIVIEQIMSSELVITEAMHGAIVSDALRVPWLPIKPLSGIHSMKWFDWASALDINLTPNSMVSSSLLESVVLFFDSRNKFIANTLRNRRHFLLKIAPETFAQRAAERLSEISKLDPSMSSDTCIERAHTQMLEKMGMLVNDLGKGKLIY